MDKRIVKRISFVNVRVFKILKEERLKFKKLFLKSFFIHLFKFQMLTIIVCNNTNRTSKIMITIDILYRVLSNSLQKLLDIFHRFKWKVNRRITRGLSLFVYWGLYVCHFYYTINIFQTPRPNTTKIQLNNLVGTYISLRKQFQIINYFKNLG